MIVQCKLFVIRNDQGLGEIGIFLAERFTEVIDISRVSDKVIDVVLVRGITVSDNTVYAL